MTACGHGIIHAGYKPELPEIPDLWDEILGAPRWKLEWLNPDGKWSSLEGLRNFDEIKMMQEWTTPVLAWPYWPEKNLHPGLFSPAGALFPWDVSGSSLFLSWEAGIDAYLWRELAANAEIRPSGTPRYPWYFDWPRFRELMKSDNVPPEVRLDPWLADWKEFAKKTAESGFDRRRIKVEPRTILTINPCPDIIWAGYSAFGAPVETEENGILEIPVKITPETWVSESGFLRCQKGTWIFIPWTE